MSEKHTGSIFYCCLKNHSPPEVRKARSQENLIWEERKKKKANLNANVNPGFSQSQFAYNNNTVVNPEHVKLEQSHRTEDIEPNMAAEIAGLVARLEAVTARLENATGGGGGGGGSASSPEVLAQFVVAYDDILNGPFTKFVSLSNQIGGDVQTQVAMVKSGFDSQREFLVKASKCKQPAQNDLQQALMPQANGIQAIQEFREKNRGSSFFNHLSAISESIPALGWVAIYIALPGSPAPGPYVKEMSDAGQFYTNRVLKEYRDKDATHVDWVKAWLQTLGEIQAYIKQYHTTGVTWNKQGVELSQVGSTGAPPPPPPGGLPPPPPPGPPPPPVDLSAPTQGTESVRGALLADLNKGTDITKVLKPVKKGKPTVSPKPGLKKVSDDQKTHKNPNLRLDGPQPYKASPNASPKPFKPFTPGGGAAAKPVVKPPRFELEGKKWMVEHQQGNRNLVLDDTNMKQTVYVYRCENSTIQIKGKVNSITMDGCKKSAVVFEDAISSVEFINCQSVQAQVTGVVPTISIDKTDGCMVYLSKGSINAEIVSAKSSEMNILVPQDDGEYKEFAIPEQFKTKYNGKKLVTDCTDINA